MKDENKTKKQLIHELVEMRQRVAESKTWETERERAKEALWESEERYPPIHSLRTIEDLEPGDHLCCIYETEEEHRAVITPSLRQGLERGEKVIYIVDAHAAETILGYLRDDGVDVEPYLSRRQLILLTRDDAYIREGVFDPEGMIALLRAETERALAEGYSALRVTGEMTWALRGLPGSERLIEYEAKLNEFFPCSKCLAICQYDRRRFDPEVLLEVLRTHPIAVVGTAVYDNLYYIPPRELLGHHVPVAKLRHWVQNLAERKRAEEALAKQATELSEINESLKEKERLLAAFDRIGQTILSSLDLQQVLDSLGEQIVEIGIFRSLMIALVDEESRSVEVARVFVRVNGSIGRDSEAIGTRYDLDDPNITAEVARTGEMQVIVEWDDRFDKRFNTPEGQKGNVAYFIPVKHGDRVLAVLATASLIEEKEETLQRIEVMHPLLNEVAIALEHARLYETLRESEESYKELADSIADVFFAMDENLRYIYWNSASEKLTGIPARDALGKSLYELFPDTPQTRSAAKVYSDVLRTQQPRSFVNEYQLEGKDYFFEISAYPSEHGLSVFAKDITERMRVEEEIRKARNDYLAITNLTGDVIVHLDKEGRWTFLNDGACEFWGRPGEELIGNAFVDYLHPDDQEEAVIVVQEMIKSKKLLKGFVNKQKTPKGWRAVEWNAAPLFDEAGNYAGMQATGRDITERKRVEERMAVVNEITRIVNSSLDIEEVYQAFLAQVAKLVAFDRSGIAVPDASGGTLVSLAYAFDVPTPQYEIKSPLRGTGTEWTFEHLIPLYEPDLEKERRFSESQVLFEKGSRSYVVLPLVYEGRGIGALSLASREPNAYSEEDLVLLEQIAGQLTTAVRNVQLFEETRQRTEELSSQTEALKHAYAELQQAQEQLIQTEKLRALGEMASGVAHDFNNLLGAILGRTQLMLMHPEDEEDIERGLKLIERAALDGAETVRRIQEFTRIRRDRILGRVDINEVVRGAVEVTRPKWRDQAQRAGVTIAVEMGLGEVGPVEGSDSELREVLINLILNAVDAMPEGGTIRLETEVKEDSVYLSISDTGIGMSKEIQQKIFDPFFSTKGVRGDGLGLSVAYGIVTRHKGEISVESAKGQGTTFIIQLPVAWEAREVKETKAPTMEVKAMRILVIDDEESIAYMLSEMLNSMGHHVSMAFGGKGGMEQFEKEAFDVVFTDLGMPEMSGWEVARAVKALNPATFVLLVTGWGVELSRKQLKESGVHAVLPKPFKMTDLSRKIAEIDELKTMKNEQ